MFVFIFEKGISELVVGIIFCALLQLWLQLGFLLLALVVSYLIDFLFLFLDDGVCFERYVIADCLLVAIY